MKLTEDAHKFNLIQTYMSLKGLSRSLLSAHDIINNTFHYVSMVYYEKDESNGGCFCYFQVRLYTMEEV
jgi:hypothetical protein